MSRRFISVVSVRQQLTIFCMIFQASNGVWHEMNDNQVSVVSLQTVLSCQAYILFYSRVMSVAKPEETAPVKPVPVPSNGASIGPNADVGEIVAPLIPAVFAHIPAPTPSSTTVTVPAVDSTDKGGSYSLYRPLSQEDIELKEEIVESNEMTVVDDEVPASASATCAKINSLIDKKRFPSQSDFNVHEPALRKKTRVFPNGRLDDGGATPDTSVVVTTRSKLANLVFNADVDRGHLRYAVKQYLLHFGDKKSSCGTRRRSLDRSRFSRGSVPINRIGETFRFVNREEQCLQMLHLFWSMHLIFLSQGAHDPSKLLYCPAVLGLRGIGKSSFACEMLKHLLAWYEREKWSDLDLLRDMKKAGMRVQQSHMPSAATSSQSDDEITAFTDFLNRLRSHKVLNLTISLDDMRGVNNSNADRALHSLCIAMLYQALKYKIGGDYVDGDDDKRNYEEFYLYLNMSEPKLLTIQNTMGVIAEITETTAVIINFDEVNLLTEETLCQLLLQLKHVIVHGCSGAPGVPLYFSLSGLFHSTIPDAVKSSGMCMIEVILPPLKEAHMVQIIGELLGVKRFRLNPFLSNLMWLLGGVPRYLAFALADLARTANTTDPAASVEATALLGEEKLCSLLESLDSSTMYGAVQRVEEKIHPGAIAGPFDNSDVMGHLVALAVSECKVPDDFQLRQDVDKGMSRRPKYTINNARFDQLIYHAADKSILIPPLLLSIMHQNDVRSQNKNLKENHMVCVLHTLRNHLEVRENESLYIAVLLQRMKAQLALNNNSMMLSNLLGIDPDPEVFTDIPIKPFAAGFITSGKKLDNSNMEEFLQDAPAPVRAFINGFKAPYADAGLVLPEVVILVQEKSSVLDKRASASSGELSAASPADPQKELFKEYEKVFGKEGDRAEQEKLKKWLGKRRILFIYITDGSTRSGRPRCEPYANIPANMIVLTNELHKQCFGALVARLRLHTIANNSLDMQQYEANSSVTYKINSSGALIEGD